MSKPLPSPGYARGTDYPHVTPDLFKSASLIRVNSGEIIKGEHVDKLRILESTSAITAPGTSSPLPGYTLRLGGYDAVTHTDRIAIIGIGSNCAPDVLLHKFQKAGIGGDFILAQASLDHHTVCHGAFLGRLGTIPATVMPHQGTTSHLTVGFYTPEQAAALTESEQNYDLVAINSPLSLRNTATPHTLPEKALLYVAVWGGIRDPQNTTLPIALEAVPQNTPLRTMNSPHVMQHIASILGRGDHPQSFFDEVAHSMPVETRLMHNWALALHALPASIKGTCIKESNIGELCAQHGTKIPRIDYT